MMACSEPLAGIAMEVFEKQGKIFIAGNLVEPVVFAVYRPVAVGVLIVHLFLLYAYRKHYSGMFVARRME